MPVLLSYACYSDWLGKGYDQSFARILIDSGAYSEFSSGTKIDLGAYADWSQRWVGHADAIAGLDDIAGNWKRSLRNYEAFPLGFPTFHESDPAELLTLFAVALQSGLATRDCLAAAEREFAANGSGENGGEEAVAVRWQREQVEALTDLSFKTGVALSGLLNAAADARRSEVWAAQRQLIEKLGVRLMLPLGLVVLPAFVLIGIIPVVVGMLSGA